MIPTEYLIHMREEMEDIWRSEVNSLQKTAVSIEKAYQVNPDLKNKMKDMALKASGTKAEGEAQAIANHPKAKQMAALAEKMGRKIMQQRGHGQLASGYGKLPTGTKGMS
jgi:hypothetical protein